MKTEVVIVIRDDSDGVVFEGSKEEAEALYNELRKALGKQDVILPTIPSDQYPWSPTSTKWVKDWTSYGTGSAPLKAPLKVSEGE